MPEVEHLQLLAPLFGEGGRGGKDRKPGSAAGKPGGSAGRCRQAVPPGSLTSQPGSWVAREPPGEQPISRAAEQPSSQGQHFVSIAIFMGACSECSLGMGGFAGACAVVGA